MREYQSPEIPFWTRVWQAVKPPPAVPGQKKLNPTQRRMLMGGFVAILLLAGAAGVFYWIDSASERAQAAFQEGMKLEAQNDHNAALAAFDRSIAVSDQQPQAFLQRGRIKRILKQLDAALDDFERAAALDPRLADAFTGRGMILLDRG